MNVLPTHADAALAAKVRWHAEDVSMGSFAFPSFPSAFPSFPFGPETPGKAFVRFVPSVSTWRLPYTSFARSVRSGWDRGHHASMLSIVRFLRRHPPPCTQVRFVRFLRWLQTMAVFDRSIPLERGGRGQPSAVSVRSFGSLPALGRFPSFPRPFCGPSSTECMQTQQRSSWGGQEATADGRRRRSVAAGSFPEALGGRCPLTSGRPLPPKRQAACQHDPKITPHLTRHHKSQRCQAGQRRRAAARRRCP